jgi:hypothetical protein
MAAALLKLNVLEVVPRLRFASSDGVLELSECQQGLHLIMEHCQEIRLIFEGVGKPTYELILQSAIALVALKLRNLLGRLE